jgi:hypothetical protein
MSGTAKVVLGVVGIAAVAYFAVSALAPRPAAKPANSTSSTAFLGGFVTAVTSLFKGAQASQQSPGPYQPLDTSYGVPGGASTTVAGVNGNTLAGAPVYGPPDPSGDTGTSTYAYGD